MRPPEDVVRCTIDAILGDAKDLPSAAEKQQAELGNTASSPSLLEGYKKLSGM